MVERRQTQAPTTPSIDRGKAPVSDTPESFPSLEEEESLPREEEEGSQNSTMTNAADTSTDLECKRVETFKMSDDGKVKLAGGEKYCDDEFRCLSPEGQACYGLVSNV